MDKATIPRPKLIRLIICIVLVFAGFAYSISLIIPQTHHDRLSLANDVLAADQLYFVIAYYHHGEIRYIIPDDFRLRSPSADLRFDLLNFENDVTFTEFLVLPNGQYATYYVSPTTIVAWPTPLTHGMLKSHNRDVMELQHRVSGEREFYYFFNSDLLTHHWQIFLIMNANSSIGRHMRYARDVYGDLSDAYLNQLMEEVRQ